jgi:membrane associated rhomboid family serine protease
MTSAVLVVVNVLTIIGFGTAQNSAGIAWEAHLGGYVVGLITYGLFDNASALQDDRKPNVD